MVRPSLRVISGTAARHFDCKPNAEAVPQPRSPPSRLSPSALTNFPRFRPRLQCRSRFTPGD